MSQDALGQLKHLKTARARWPFPDVVCLRPPPRPPPSSPSSSFFSPSSLSSFSPSSLSSFSPSSLSSFSVLFVVIILLIWWLWGSIRGRGVHSFAGGLVIWWSCCPVSCCHGGRIVGVCCCAGCIVVVVVGLSLSWLGCRGWVVVVGLSWLGCRCHIWVVLVVVVVAPSSSWLRCCRGVVALVMHALGLAARHSTRLALPRRCVIHGWGFAVAVRHAGVVLHSCRGGGYAGGRCCVNLMGIRTG